MTRRFAVLVFAAVIGSSAGALAQGSAGYAPIVLQVACGGEARPACVKVVPMIASRTVQAGINLKPSGSGLALDTAAAVCEGEAAAAVVQRDALALIARQPSCTGRYDVIGRPLYPWYAFLVVKTGAPFRELGDMAGKRLVVTGSPGSGGQIALSFLLRSDPALQKSVAVAMGDPDIALARVANGSADGFFALDTLDSDLIDRVRMTVDAHGKPFYSFIDIRPQPEFFRTGDGAGHCLYRLDRAGFRRRRPGHDGFRGYGHDSRPRIARRSCEEWAARVGRSIGRHRCGGTCDPGGYEIAERLAAGGRGVPMMSR